MFMAKGFTLKDFYSSLHVLLSLELHNTYCHIMSVPTQIHGLPVLQALLSGKIIWPLIHVARGINHISLIACDVFS